MKIILIAYRAWQAGRRLRSLAINAKRLGHQVWGFTASGNNEEAFIITVFNELGVEAYPGGELPKRIDEINPDLIVGEHFHPDGRVEMLAQEWPNKHNKLAFMLYHTEVSPYQYAPYLGLRSHLMVTNEAQKAVMIHPNTPERHRWPADNVHVFGGPDFDFVTEKIDIPAIRARLGAEPGQPLIGFFPYGDVPSQASLVAIMQEAKNKNWRVVVHIAPDTRCTQNDSSDSDSGFFGRNEWRQPLLALQSMGAMITDEFAPGVTNGVQFHRCPGYELEAAADCLLTVSPDIPWEAYALKKRCNIFSDSLLNPAFSMEFWVLADLLDEGYERGHSDIEKIQHALGAGSNFREQNPEITVKGLYKLDGLWWQRALNLAQKLTKL